MGFFSQNQEDQTEDTSQLCRECMTDNPARCVQRVKEVLHRHGSVIHNGVALDGTLM